MSYRKININGIEYEYTIGRKFTKIKRGPIFENSKIGNRIMQTDSYIVTPRNVRNALLGLPVPVFHCAEHNVTTSEVACWPFDAQIYGKDHYGINCRQCHERNADDI